jgi:hypothetical protein
MVKAMSWRRSGYTLHGWLRRNQRCKRQRPIDLVHEHFDLDIHRGRDLWAISISAERVEWLVATGAISRADADGVHNLVLLIAERDWTIVSVLRDNGGLGAYRRAA